MPAVKSGPYNVSDLEHERASDFRRVYSNSAGLATTFYDVTVIFGEITGTAPGIVPKIEDRVGVAMSWEHLKALYVALGRAIATYEAEQKTTIRTPSSAVPDATPSE